MSEDSPKSKEEEQRFSTPLIWLLTALSIAWIVWGFMWASASALEYKAMQQPQGGYEEFLQIQYHEGGNLLRLNNVDDVRILCECERCNQCGNQFLVSQK